MHCRYVSDAAAREIALTTARCFGMDESFGNASAMPIAHLAIAIGIDFSNFDLCFGVIFLTHFSAVCHPTRAGAMCSAECRCCGCAVTVL